MLLTASVAQAAPSQKLKTFGTGEVTLTGTDATIVNTAGEYGGVYIQANSQRNTSISDVDFSFTSTGDVGGGAPRFSIPIDDPTVNGSVNGYAFMDAANCGGISDESTLVSTDAATCAVFFGAGSYANWDAFATANPTFRTSPGSVAFVIADVPGDYAVTGIVLS